MLLAQLGELGMDVIDVHLLASMHKHTGRHAVHGRCDAITRSRSARRRRLLLVVKPLLATLALHWNRRKAVASVRQSFFALAAATTVREVEDVGEAAVHGVDARVAPAEDVEAKS